MRRRRWPAQWAALALLAPACGGPSGGAGVPPSPGRGRPIAGASALTGVERGSIEVAGSGGDTVTLTVSPGAIAGPTDVGLVGITMTAAGALDAFRLPRASRSGRP
jgi:hypothetical protein